MTAYQNFINNVNLKEGKYARLWELKVNETINNMIDFYREFLRQHGFIYIGYNNEHKAIFSNKYNNNYIFDGMIQDGNKIALRIIKEWIKVTF